MTHTPGRRERKRLETTDRLAATAWDLFEGEGFERVTMESIAAAADVAKGTLYKHFPMKEALLLHHFHRQLQLEQPKIMARLESIDGSRERLRTLFAIVADWSEQRRAYLPHYLHYRMSTPGRSRRSGIDRLFGWLIESGIARGELRSDLSPETGVYYISFLYLGVLLRWLNTPGLSLQEEFEQMLSLYLDGLGGEA
jgi:AcrR family transcriptional regulator